MIYSFDIDKNFWIEHPDMKVISPFKQIYEDDKSKKKSDSSMMMWFIVLCYDRTAKLFKQPIEEKHRIAGIDYCDNANYYKEHKTILDAGIQMYTDLQYTPMERLMASWDKKLHERAKWLDGLSFEDDDERVDKAMERTKKVYDGYKQIIEDMEKEMSAGQAKGGATPSLLD